MSPLDPTLDHAEEGSAGRPRRLDSMIASRRKPGDAAAKDGAKKAETKPARASKAAAKDDKPKVTPKAERSEDDKPATRRRRRTRKPAEAETQPVTTADEDAEPDQPVQESRAPEPAAKKPAAASAPVGDLVALHSEVTRLNGAVDQQGELLTHLKDSLDILSQRVGQAGTHTRLAVFVDVPNLLYGYEGDRTLHMGRLLDMLRTGRDLVRATAYSPVSDDPREPVEQQRFVQPFVRYDYRIVTKPLKRFADGSIKGNFDVEMAIDMLLMADRVDTIAVVSGDADFARAVEAVQQRGVRVEVVAFAGSTSLEMRALADQYVELGKVVDKITV